MREYLLCLQKYAQDLDDGTSDAASVGKAIVPACELEWQNLIRHATANMTDDVARATEAKIFHVRFDYAVQAVLNHRAEKRRNSN